MSTQSPESRDLPSQATEEAVTGVASHLSRAWDRVAVAYRRISRPRPADLRVLIYLLVAAVLTLGFVHIADAIREAPLSIDERILVELRNPADLSEGRGGESIQSMVRDLTALGSHTLMGLFTIGLIGHLLLARRPADALFVVFAIVSCWLLNEGLKAGFGRDRPAIVPHMMTAIEKSFPSGHTMVAATFYPTLAAMASRLLERRASRVYLIVLGILVAALVGFTRLYLGVHYPSDVLAGMAVGLAWAVVCGLGFYLLQEVRRRRAARREAAA